MGTKMAPSYATLVLGYLENELYSQVFNKMGEEIGHYFYTNWRICNLAKFSIYIYIYIWELL